MRVFQCLLLTPNNSCVEVHPKHHFQPSSPPSYHLPPLLFPSHSVTVLCGELLREAEFLVNQRIHPMTIMAGWRTAVQIARGALEQVCMCFV